MYFVNFATQFYKWRCNIGSKVQQSANLDNLCRSFYEVPDYSFSISSTGKPVISAISSAEKPLSFRRLTVF